MLSKIKIRPFTNADNLDELTLLLNASYKKLSDQGFKYLASYQNSKITKDRIDEGECFLAFSENKLIGTITYYSPAKASGNEWYNQDFVSSYGQFAVDSQFQKLGIGSELIKFVEELAISNNAKEITVDTAEGATELINYYTKKGYRFIGYTQWKTTNYRSVLLSKKLNK